MTRWRFAVPGVGVTPYQRSGGAEIADVDDLSLGVEPLLERERDFLMSSLLSVLSAGRQSKEEHVIKYLVT